MTEARLGQATQQLLKQINDIFPGEIMVHLGAERVVKSRIIKRVVT